MPWKPPAGFNPIQAQTVAHLYSEDPRRAMNKRYYYNVKKRRPDITDIMMIFQATTKDGGVELLVGNDKHPLVVPLETVVYWVDPIEPLSYF